MKALFLVDIQNDFLPGGALAVPNGNEIIPVVLDSLDKYKNIFVSVDWHPINHVSFAKNFNIEPFTVFDQEMKWPIHCVKYTSGACIQKKIHFKLLELMNKKPITFLKKGNFFCLEEYSIDKRRLLDILEDIDEVEVMGLATDYCVKNTVLSLLEIGKKVKVNLNACRGVSGESTKHAIEIMKNSGAEIIGE